MVSVVEYQIGDRDDKGEIVVFAISDRYRVLETQAALVFHNCGTEAHPQAAFDLTTQVKGHRQFSSVDALITGLRSESDLKVIDLYGTCGAPPWNGLPEEEVNRFFMAFKEAGYELRTEHDGVQNMICICPEPDE